MHPILFHIPLPRTSEQWVIFFFAVAGLAALMAAYQLVIKKSKASAATAAVVAAAAVGMRFAFRAWIAGEHATSFPIYSYGVMLGASLVVGWFLTLGLAERDGLPREQMGDCYVDTAIMAVVGARVLYVVTNLGQFNSFVDVFSMRSGGLVAYGGFLGGALGSWLYLTHGIGFLSTPKRLLNGDSGPWRPFPFLPWTDVGVPSLCSGLMITRIGCYMFGCDFGKELSPTAPTWLRALGTFPHWPEGLLDQQRGSPAWVQHLNANKIGLGAATSLPVHPTQLYESLTGLGLLVLLLLARRHQKFRGQITFLFFYAYGIARYLLEVLRDDNERGSLPIALPEHVFVPLGLAVFSVCFCFAWSQLIRNMTTRRVAQVASFIPVVVAYVMLKPESFGEAPNDSWSTSQAIAMGTAFICSVGFAALYKSALENPARAMALNLPRPKVEDADDSEADDEDDDEEDEAPAAPKKKPTDKAAPVKKGEPAGKKPPADRPDDEEDEKSEEVGE